jgi:transcriptional regulator with XRE-family HTH domain
MVAPYRANLHRSPRGSVHQARTSAAVGRFGRPRPISALTAKLEASREPRFKNNAVKACYARGLITEHIGAADAWGMNRLKRHTRTFIREWRQYRNLTQVQLRERVIMPSSEQMGQGHLSKLETGQLPYSQPILEQIADALSCSPGDLLMRDLTQDNAIWSIWDKLGKAQKRQAVRLLQAISEEKAA